MKAFKRVLECAVVFCSAAFMAFAFLVFLSGAVVCVQDFMSGLALEPSEIFCLAFIVIICAVIGTVLFIVDTSD